MIAGCTQDKHIANYGIGNERRLTGKDDTAAMSDFSWGAPTVQKLLQPAVFMELLQHFNIFRNSHRCNIECW